MSNKRTAGNARKRAHVAAASGDASAAGPPQLKKLKCRHRKKSVQFSSNVSMRCLVHNGDEGAPSSSSWICMDQVEKAKSDVRSLSRKLLQARATKEKEPDDPSTARAVRCEVGGESLRGVEHLTDSAAGRRRRLVREGAIRAVAVEQQKQLVQRVLECAYALPASSSPSSGVNQEVIERAVEMDAAKLARAYGSKTGEALAYALKVAEEDAEVAASILEEDLKDYSPLQQQQQQQQQKVPNTICAGSAIYNRVHHHHPPMTPQATPMAGSSAADPLCLGSYILRLMYCQQVLASGA